MTMYNLKLWIHKYIISKDSKYIDDDAKPHSLFYSVCQAFFHLFIARHKHFVESPSGECILYICCIKVTNLIATVLKNFLFRDIISSQS